MSVVLIEFNELSPSLMERWMSEGKLPHFKRLWSESDVWVTQCEERPPFLEPWIQWVTVHTGRSYREHGVLSLGAGHASAEKRLWDRISEAGHGVWVCGSMNVRYDAPLNGWLLPDPWATKVSPYPAEELEPYFTFVQKNVQEYTKGGLTVSPADAARFVGFMATHGLSPGTAGRVAGQLAGERLGWAKPWRRAALLDELQFDLFRWYYRRGRPAFSTFFLNSTAHLQHFHWRNMAPEAFVVQPSPSEQAEHRDTILWGYQRMDRLIARFMSLAGPDATLVFCTALSQQPCLKYEERGGKVGYRPRDFSRLLAFAGVEGEFKVAPVMSEEFFLHAEDPSRAEAAERRLKALRVGGREVLALRRDGSSILCGCRIFEELPKASELECGDARAPFFELFYRIGGMKSGMHHPDGMLWVRGPARRHRVRGEKLPLTRVAPMILEMFGLGLPSPS